MHKKGVSSHEDRARKDVEDREGVRRMTIIEHALEKKVDEKKTVSIGTAIYSYAPEVYSKLCDNAKRRESPTKTLIQAMIENGIITSIGDWKHLKREFVDKTIGVSSGNTVRVYESQVKRFLKIIGVEIKEIGE